MKIMSFHVLTWKSRKKLRSHARVDFSEGCKSIGFSKVLGRVYPPWPGFLPQYPILVEMGGFSQHFMKMRWFYTIFRSVGWKWCFGGPGARTQAKPMLFLCIFRGPGQWKCVFRWIITKNAVSGAFLVKITKMGGFTKFPPFWCSPRPGPPRRHGIYMYYKGFCKVRREQEKVLILHMLPRFYTFSCKIMNLHEFLAFWWNFHEMHENHELACTPAPGPRNSMYYCTILHVLGSSFRWVSIIFM